MSRLIRNFIYILLLDVYLNSSTSESPGPMNVTLTPENALISDMENVTLQCVVGNADPYSYTISWSHSPQDSQVDLQSNGNFAYDPASRTLTSSLTLSNPGSNFVAAFLFCEVHYLGRGGPYLVDFAKSFVSNRDSQKDLKRQSECFRSDDQGRVIHLLQDGPPVLLSCKVAREPVVPELRWKALRNGSDIDSRELSQKLDFSRDDNGQNRGINSTLPWDPYFDGLIFYCKATTYRDLIVAQPCIIGLIKVIQQPRLIPQNTSIEFGLVNEAEFWCDVRGLSPKSCSYTWTCEPPLPNCNVSSDSLVIGVNEPSSLGYEIKVTCCAKCVGSCKEAHAMLTIQRKLPIITTNSQQMVAGSTDHSVVTLELQSNLEGWNNVTCFVNYTGNEKPIFTWYIDGKRDISSNVEDINQQGTLSIYRLDDSSFKVVACDVLLNNDITRVWSTFTELFGVTTENNANSITTYLTNDSVGQPSPTTALNKPVPVYPSESSRWLIGVISLCGLMAVVVFVSIGLSSLKRKLHRKPDASSKVKTFRAEPQERRDDTHIASTPSVEGQKDAFGDSAGDVCILDDCDYAYPAFQNTETNTKSFDNNREELAEILSAYHVYNQTEESEIDYEELPGEEQCPQWLRDDHDDLPSVNHWTSTHHLSSTSSSSSSHSSSTPPLIHEYHTTLYGTPTPSRSYMITGYRFIKQDTRDHGDTCDRLYHEYFA